ncbi:hypothetical protein [Chitinophaga dinghuensis]|nr:hypothetical protein [Chitinophaga dinghuensis]
MLVVLSKGDTIVCALPAVVAATVTYGHIIQIFRPVLVYAVSRPL